jgi:P2-related tail formation protein
VRAGWRNARWLGSNGKPIDLITVLRKGTKRGLIDQSIWIARRAGPPLALRLVAVKKLPQAAEAARRKAQQEAVKGDIKYSKGTLLAAEWVILVTSLAPKIFTTAHVLALHRLRWRLNA